MPVAKTLAEWMAERGVNLAGLVAATGLDERVVKAIAQVR